MLAPSPFALMFALSAIGLFGRPVPPLPQTEKDTRVDDAFETKFREHPLPDASDPKALEAGLPVLEKAELPPLVARDGKLDWGIALSGGGIRSSAFCLGVLKGLYEVGVVQRCDAISSVSGGGYALYGLLDAHRKAKAGTPFGQPLLNDASFIDYTYHFSRYGTRFFTPLEQLNAFFSSRASAFGGYEAEIRRAYGKDSTATWDVAGQDEAQRLPLYIINTTMNKPGLPGQVFSIMPTGVLIEGEDFYKWKSPNRPTVELSKAVAISGAAVKWKLGQEMSGIVGGARETRQLSDGGHSENLGAFTLIRLGLPNIVIVDAEYDSDYNFGSYSKLKERIVNPGGIFEVRAIDEFLKDRQSKTFPFLEGVAEGKARWGTAGKEVRIVYIKMSRAKQLYDNEANIMKEGSNADLVFREVDKAYGIFDRDYPSQRRKSVDALLPLSVNPDRYSYRILRYSNWLDSRDHWRAVGYRFPQTPTLDQSFYVDQYEAFVGLGYIFGRKVPLQVK